MLEGGQPRGWRGSEACSDKASTGRDTQLSAALGGTAHRAKSFDLREEKMRAELNEGAQVSSKPEVTVENPICWFSVCWSTSP